MGTHPMTHVHIAHRDSHTDLSAPDIAIAIQEK